MLVHIFIIGTKTHQFVIKINVQKIICATKE